MSEHKTRREHGHEHHFHFIFCLKRALLLAGSPVLALCQFVRHAASLICMQLVFPSAVSLLC